MVYSNRKNTFCVIFPVLIILICWFGYPYISPIFSNMLQNPFFILLIACIELLGVYLLLALLSAFIFFVFIWSVFPSISQLGVYKKLNTEDPLNGESLGTKIKKIYKINFILSIFLMIVILYFLYPSTGTTTFDSTATTFSEIDHIYILAFAFVPAFLLSIRVLANPTKKCFFKPYY